METPVVYTALSERAQRDTIDALLNDAKTGMQDAQCSFRDSKFISASVQLDCALGKAQHARRELTLLLVDATPATVATEATDAP